MTSRRYRSAAILVNLVLAACLAAGCGSVGSGGPDASAGGGLAVVRSPVDQGQTGSRRADVVRSSDPVSTAHAARIGRYPAGHDTDEKNDTGADPLHPCRWVTRSEAAAILGRRVTTSEAPQGPTCIYTPAGARAAVTLTLEIAPLSPLRRHAKHVAAMRVAGAGGYCLRYASPFVAVPVGASRILHVDAGSCAAAARFAARALPRVLR